MILEKIKPYGYCNGVDFAIKKLKKIIRTNPKKQIHLIGSIVHNEQTNAKFLAYKNVFLHKGLNRKKIVEKILKNCKNHQQLIFVFSTHGTDPNAIHVVAQHNCQFYNFICPYIQLIIAKIQKAIDKGYKVYFFGKSNHPETLCIKKTFSKKVKVFCNKDDVNQNNCKKYVVCQSTTNQQKFLNTKKWFKNAIFEETICNFCRSKQKKAWSLNTSNSIIVISDQKSNNGWEIFNLLKTNNKHVYFVSPNKPFNINIKKTPKIFVFTSSSVSKEQANNILKKLKY